MRVAEKERSEEEGEEGGGRKLRLGSMAPRQLKKREE